MEKLLGLRRRDLLPGARELQIDVETVVAYLRSLRPVPIVAKIEEDCKEEVVENKDEDEIIQASVPAEVQAQTPTEASPSHSPPSVVPMVFDSKIIELLIQRVCEECVILTKLFLSWTDRILVHHIVQTRIEHMCYLVQFLMRQYENEFSNFNYDHNDVKQVLFLHQVSTVDTGNVYTIVVVTLFKLFALLHCVLGSETDEMGDDEVVQFILRNGLKPMLSSLTEGRTNWYLMAFTTITKILSEILQKRPALRQYVFQTTSSQYIHVYGTWTTSSLWQVQYFALILIQSSLSLEYFQGSAMPSSSTNQVNAKPENGNNSLKKGTTSSANLTSQPSTRKMNADSKSGKSLSKLPSKKSLGSSSAPLLASSTSTKSPAIAISASKESEEICRMGYLRCIVWFLTHSHFLVRNCASEILLLMTRIASLNSSTSIMWSCCVEQGIIPLLESIAIGREIFSVTKESSVPQLTVSNLFPEESIRNTALYCLGHIATYLERDPYSEDQSVSRGTRQRLLTTLTHSGNSKLRINILTGILFLSSRSPSLGKLLWDGDDEQPFPPLPITQSAVSSKSLPQASMQNNNGKHHILSMFQSIINHDVSEIKQLLHLIIYFLHLSMKLYQFQTSRMEKVNELGHDLDSNNHFTPFARSGTSLEDDNSTIYTATNQTSAAFDEFLSEWLDRINPVILVGNTTSNANSNNQALVANRMMTGGLAAIIKMVCPLLPIIGKHCTSLAKDIKEYHTLQLRECYTILSYRQSEVLNVEKEVKTILSHNTTLDEKLFLKLHGSYTLWQEIFSHMTDTFLRKQSIARMSLSQLIEALSIATHYYMPELIESYIVALIERLSVATIVQIMPCILYERSKHNANLLQKQNTALSVGSNQGVHLALCIHCIEFLRSHWDEIRRKLPPPQFQSLLSQVTQLMSLFLL